VGTVRNRCLLEIIIAAVAVAIVLSIFFVTRNLLFAYWHDIVMSNGNLRMCTKHTVHPSWARSNHMSQRSSLAIADL
jgi:hypothetical protein